MDFSVAGRIRFIAWVLLSSQKKMANAWDNDKFGSEFQTLNDFFQKSVVIQNFCAKLLQIILKNEKINIRFSTI